MAKPSLFLIGNPRSGRGNGAVLLERAQSLLRARGQEPVVLPTQRPTHAVELARHAGEQGADLVLVVGGDGTVRDVAEGLALCGAHAALGILPGGTGNDLTRTLGLPRTLPEALEVALEGRDRELDLWRWNQAHFLNVAGLGLDAAVAAEVNRRFHNMRGPLPYVLALLAVLPRLQPQPVRLTWTGGEYDGKVWLAAFGNARYYGGGMAIAPDAIPDDGLLDAVLIGNVSRLELLRQLPGLFHGRHVRHPQVRCVKAAGYRLEAAEQDATIDGELIGRTPAVIEHAAYRVRVRVPRAG